MSYLSGRHMSRDDYNRTANFVSDSPNDSERGAGEADEDHALLPGNHGGRGTGLAGGYPGSQSRSPPSRQPPSESSSKLSSDPTPTPAPAPLSPAGPIPAHAHALAHAGAGDDPYAGYDPGMAGCTVEQSTCHIPGLPWIGASPSQAQARSQFDAHARAHVAGTSRGYERDADEYADVLEASSSSVDVDVDVGTGTSAVDPPHPNPNPNPNPTDPNPNPDPFADPPNPNPHPNPNPGPHPNSGHPSIGTRLVGRVQRLAGKVLRDPDIEARGKRHMTGHL